MSQSSSRVPCYLRLANHAEQVIRLFGVIVTASLSLSWAASAHVVFEQNQAEAGTGYKAVMKVGHGCAGSATTAIRVRIPEGVIDVKPMPKAGWTLTTRAAKYSRTIPACTAER
jgi:uncharacterized protein YcnI